ncbi:MAG: hypothetical protein WB820_15505, partial [Rhodoplanes sp.]
CAMILFRHKPIVTEIDFCAWLSQAEPGHTLEYHRGFLVLDTDPIISKLPRLQRLELIQVASRARWASNERLVHLLQRRLDDSQFSYLAIARERPQTPSLSSMLLAEVA